MKISKRWMFSASTLAVVLAAGSICLACSVPVFRYALEQWPPDAYQLYLFHRGELTEQQRAAATRLGAGDPLAEVANVRLSLVDLDANPEVAELAIWEAESPAHPATEALLVLHSPARHGAEAAVWSGEATVENVDAVIESPLRQQIAQRILQGDSVVWVLLESGDRAADDAAYDTLTTEIARLEQTLELSAVTEEDASALSIDADAIKLAFSAARVGRDDPAERVFVEMLLHVEPDLKDPEFIGQPMVFPVFGRGRALYSLVGAGVSAAMIEEAARFLTGDCQCTVKAQNPGADLLLAVDWDRLVAPTLQQDSELPPLSGLASFLDEQEQSANQESVAQETVVENRGYEVASAPEEPEEQAAIVVAESPLDAPTAPGGPRVGSVGVMAFAVLLAIGLGVAVASVVLVRRES